MITEPQSLHTRVTLGRKLISSSHLITLRTQSAMAITKFIIPALAVAATAAGKSRILAFQFLQKLPLPFATWMKYEGDCLAFVLLH